MKKKSCQMIDDLGEVSRSFVRLQLKMSQVESLKSQ